MKDKDVADHFGIPIRTYARYKIAPIGSWRKRIYYLMMEELLRIEKEGNYSDKIQKDT